MFVLILSMLMLGLTTSLHCVSMCGPMVFTYAVKGVEGGPWSRKLIPNLAYQGAKILSYVMVGLVLGTIGSAFKIDGVRPYVMLFAGGFMIVMGLGMTGKVPWAAKLVPRPPKALVAALSSMRHKARADASAGENSLLTPVGFGLLTGLMPCAPLMVAELAAAGTGTPVGGALAMLAFGLGTVPLMLVFGTASSLLSKGLRRRMASALAIVVIVLGAVYLNRAAMRLGSPVTFDSVKQTVLGMPAVDSPSVAASATATTNGGDASEASADGVVEVPLTIENVTFSPAIVQIPADKPVRLVVDRKESNACSDQLAIPQLGITADLKANGVTYVEIPSAKAGQYTLTCGMGMMSGRLIVGGDGSTPASSSQTLPWLLITLSAIGGVVYLARTPRRPIDPKNH